MKPKFTHPWWMMPLAATVPLHGHAADLNAAAVPEVVISAPRDSTATTGGTQHHHVADTAALLRGVAGVGLAGAGGVSSLPILHGLGDDRLRIQVDGMDLVSACANHMNPPLSYLAPAQVDTLEVLNGVVPVSAGGDSIGGTIRVRSAEPRFAANGQGTLAEGQVSAYLRSNGDARGGDVAATYATDTLSLHYNGATAQADNYVAGGDFKAATLPTGRPHQLGADEVGSSGFRAHNQSLAVAMRAGQQLLELRLGMQRMPYQGFPNQRMDLTGNDSEQVNLRHLAETSWGSVETRLYHEHTRHAMQFGDDKQYWYGPRRDIPGMPMDTAGHNSGASARAEVRVSVRDTVRMGTEWQRYRLDDWWSPSGGGMAPDTFWNIRDGKRDRASLYAEWDARWSPQWFTQLGVRGERVRSDAGPVQGYNAMSAADMAAFNGRPHGRRDHNLDFTAQARYTPDASSAYALGLARKSRSPNLYERYGWATDGMSMNMVNLSGDGNGYVGDIGLRPEVAHTLSASAEWHDAAQEAWSLTLAPYYTYVDDYIDARCLKTCRANSFVFLRWANQDARLYGADLSGRLLLARGGAFGRLNMTGVLSYLRGKNTAAGDNLYNIMPLNARLSLAQSLGRWSNTAELEAAAAKDRVSAVRNELRTAGYGLLHLRTRYAWQATQLEVGVENALDRAYALPLGGAYVGQGKTMSQMGTPYGIAVPGKGRSSYAAVTATY
ncbi:MAG TPA: TonB-dependent receptor [Burkholderiaceae bacterium]|nr:TonB-dependent receptor [Burkholderiaceae bacterium]